MLSAEKLGELFCISLGLHYLCAVKRKILLAIVFCSLALCAIAQDKKRQEVDMDSPTFVPTVKVGKVLEDGDSIQYM